MPNSATLNQTQREQFKDQLRDLCRNAKTVLLEKSAEAHAGAFQKLLEHQGATQLAADYETTKTRLDSIKKQLEDKGFEIGYRDDRLSMSSDCPEDARTAYATFLNEQIGTERDRVNKLEEAISNSWSIATLSEAKTLVDSFAQ